jgi:hypothetical protein
MKFTKMAISGDKKRHHCRKCGNSICGLCSQKKLLIEQDGEPEKVCDDCAVNIENLHYKIIYNQFMTE